MRTRQARIKRAKAPAIYSVGQSMMSKEKMRFAKGFEQNLTHEFCWISKPWADRLGPCTGCSTREASKLDNSTPKS